MRAVECKALIITDCGMDVGCTQHCGMIVIGNYRDIYGCSRWKGQRVDRRSVENVTVRVFCVA